MSLSFSAKNPFIVAELSANHLQDFDVAIESIHAIAQTGADSVKVQTYKPDALSLDIDNEYFGPKTEGLWKGHRPYEIYQKAAMPWEWQPKLKELAESLGLQFFSSPFDQEAVDYLESMNVKLYKIASLEITDIPLIQSIASQKKSMILSTGAAALEDIELAVQSCRDAGNDDLTLLQCTSEYPAPLEKANLARMMDMKERFQVAVGLSDHTLGITVPIAAAALGAEVIEKHFTLNRNHGGPDAAFSLEPSEFKEMVEGVRNARKAVGKIDYSLAENNRLRRRSLFVTKDIEAGEPLSSKNIKSLRPGHGLHPQNYPSVLGKKAKEFIPQGTPLSWSLIE